MWSPTSADFKTNRLTAEDKEKFLDEHNKFRGMVKPTSADMEFMVSDRDNMTVKDFRAKLKSLRFQVLTSKTLRRKAICLRTHA